MKTKSKVLYYAGWNSFTHIGCAYNLAKIMPEVDFHVASAEKWPFEPLPNLTFHKLYRPNCAMRIDEKFYLHTYPYEKELGDVKRYRKHFFSYIDLVKKVDPNLILVDITLEIAVWSKYLGYPVGLFYETFDSNNLRHQLAWDNVDEIFVRYPKKFVEQIENNINLKMVFLGGVSKFDLIDKMPSKEESADEIGLKSDDRKVITILSSSHSHNNAQVRRYFETICEAMNVESDKYQVFMLYPKKDSIITHLQHKYKNINYVVGVFNKVHNYLINSDMVITGAGMGATMESAYFRVPMLMIPVPWIISEQMMKAKALEDIGVAHVVDPIDMTPEVIRIETEAILSCPETVEKMKDAERALIDKKGYQRLAQKVRKMLRSSSAISKSSVLND